MLASGVDLIIEQVVNPRIYSVFKPAIDQVVCEHLQIDPTVMIIVLNYKYWMTILYNTKENISKTFLNIAMF